MRSALTPLGLSRWPQLNTKCYLALKGSGSFGGVAPADILRANADLAPLYEILDANEAGTLHLNVPVFVGQGMKDADVRPAATELLTRQLRANSATVGYHTYREATHGAPEVLASRSDIAAFAARRFATSH